jgi:hypothetical protein
VRSAELDTSAWPGKTAVRAPGWRGPRGQRKRELSFCLGGEPGPRGCRGRPTRGRLVLPAGPLRASLSSVPSLAGWLAGWLGSPPHPTVIFLTV